MIFASLRFQFSAFSSFLFFSSAIPASPRDPRLISLRGLPSAGSVGSHPPRDVSPFGLLIQPTAQPPCCLVPSQPPLACVLRCATVASFAPAHLALRAACGRLPSQPPLACVPVSGFRFQVSGFCFLPPPRSPRLRVSPFPVFLPPFECLQCCWIRSKTVKSGEMTKNEQFLS